MDFGYMDFSLTWTILFQYFGYMAFCFMDFSLMDHFSRDKRGPSIRSVVTLFLKHSSRELLLATYYVLRNVESTQMPTSPWPHRSINTCENLLRDNFPSGIEEKFHLSTALGLLHCFLAGCKTSVLHAPPDCETKSRGGKLHS